MLSLLSYERGCILRSKPIKGFDMKRKPNCAKWVNRKYILGVNQFLSG
uniref:Uncharacterized protein n=1 Tax=Arundo donax TaxID=35708 RepID=A0A0A9GBH6_ARUDO